jgi:hypothetical protein
MEVNKFSVKESEKKMEISMKRLPRCINACIRPSRLMPRSYG